MLASIIIYGFFIIFLIEFLKIQKNTILPDRWSETVVFIWGRTVYGTVLWSEIVEMGKKWAFYFLY